MRISHLETIPNLTRWVRSKDPAEVSKACAQLCEYFASSDLDREVRKPAGESWVVTTACTLVVNDLLSLDDLQQLLRATQSTLRLILLEQVLAKRLLNPENTFQIIRMIDQIRPEGVSPKVYFANGGQAKRLERIAGIMTKSHSRSNSTQRLRAWNRLYRSPLSEVGTQEINSAETSKAALAAEYVERPELEQARYFKTGPAWLVTS